MASLEQAGPALGSQLPMPRPSRAGTTFGIEEEYQFSNAEAAANFARAFSAYQVAISTQ